MVNDHERYGLETDMGVIVTEMSFTAKTVGEVAQGIVECKETRT